MRVSNDRSSRPSSARSLRLSLLSGLLVVALGAGFGVAGTASARKHKPAKTTVTITAESDGFFGFVKSPKTHCANNRKVTLFQQTGNVQNPSTDTKYMTENAEQQGNLFRWDTGNSGNVTGKFYARAGRIPGCRPDSSISVSQPQGN